MKHRTQLKLLLLLLVFVLFCGVACAAYPDDPPSTDGNGPQHTVPSFLDEQPAPPADTTIPVTQETEAPAESTTPQQPETTTFPGESTGESCPHITPGPYYEREITVLYWEDRQHEEFIAEYQTGEVVNDAIFYRNLSVTERIGITQSYILINGNASNTQSWQKYILNDVQAAEGAFNVAAGYSLSMASTSALGVFQNLLDPRFNVLSLDSPWWMSSLTETATISDRLFLVSGDMALSTSYMMYACYVNQDMATALGLESVPALVRNGLWTYDKMIQMAAGAYSDVNGNKTKDLGDCFGYMTSGIHTDPWFYGSGATILENDNGTLKISDTFDGQVANNSLIKANALLWGGNDGLYTTSTAHQIKEFAENRLLFMTDYIDAALDLGVEDVKYMAVPFPKYSIDQAEYITTMGNPFTIMAVSICNKATDFPMLSAYLECMAAESHRQLLPAVFENSFRIKYAPDSDQREMFDVIRAGISIDPGRLYSGSLIGQGLWRNVMSSDLSAYSSDAWHKTCLQYGKALEKSLSSFLGSYNNAIQ